MGKKRTKSKTKQKQSIDVGDLSVSLEKALRDAILQGRLNFFEGQPSRFGDIFEKLFGQYSTQLEELLSSVEEGFLPTEKRESDDLISSLMKRGAISSEAGTRAISRHKERRGLRRAQILPSLSATTLQALERLNPEIATSRLLSRTPASGFAAFAPRTGVTRSRGTYSPSVLDNIQQGVQIAGGIGGLFGFGGGGGGGNLRGAGSMQAIQNFGGSPYQPFGQIGSYGFR